MLTDITRRERVTQTDYSLSIGIDGAGFGFSCNKEGNLLNVQPWSLASAMYEERGIRFWSWGNLNRAISWYMDDDNVTMKIETYQHTWMKPAEGKCPCGATVELDYDHGHGIDCDCGRIYNMSGQELAPRSQWEDRWDDDSTQPYNVEFGYAGEDY